MHYKNWLIGLGLIFGFCSAAQAIQHEYKIVGYYLARADANRHYKLSDVQPAKLTHLNYAFAAIKNGEVALNDGLPAAQSEADFAELQKLKAANRHLQTLISVGGWAGSKDFSNIALSDATRARFAASAVRFVRQHHFDGIDIDWEFPVAGGDEGNARRPEDRHNYTLLFAELRKQLDHAGKQDHRHYLLTAAIGNNPQFLANTEMDQVARILDWTNIMTYDFAGHWNAYAGHHTPLYSDADLKRADADTSASVSAIVTQTLKAGVPPAKLVLGVPFYGYSWKQCNAQDHGQLQDCHGKGRGTWEDGVLDFADIDANLIDKNGFVRYWNDTAKAAWLFNADTGEFVSYEDPQSLAFKIGYIKEHGLGGAMFWEISSDSRVVLQNQLVQGLSGH